LYGPFSSVIIVLSGNSTSFSFAKRASPIPNADRNFIRKNYPSFIDFFPLIPFISRDTPCTAAALLVFSAFSYYFPLKFLPCSL